MLFSNISFIQIWARSQQIFLTLNSKSKKRWQTLSLDFKMYERIWHAVNMQWIWSSKSNNFSAKWNLFFYNKVRKFCWSKNIQTLNWNFIIQIFKNIEHIKLIIIIVNSDQILTVWLNFNLQSDSDYWSRSQQSSQN